jgi:hypothetical protein
MANPTAKTIYYLPGYGGQLATGLGRALMDRGFDVAGRETRGDFRSLPFDEQMKRRDEVEELLKQVKRILLPELPDNASKGYNGSEFIGNTYQIYRTILHQLAIDNNWNNVFSSSSLPSGTLGTIKVEAIDGL